MFVYFGDLGDLGDLVVIARRCHAASIWVSLNGSKVRVTLFGVLLDTGHGGHAQPARNGLRVAASLYP